MEATGQQVFGRAMGRHCALLSDAFTGPGPRQPRSGTERWKGRSLPVNARQMSVRATRKLERFGLKMISKCTRCNGELSCDPSNTEVSLAASCALSQSDRSLTAPRERQSVRAVPDVNQGIIRFLDPIGQRTWEEQQFLLHLCAVGHRLVDGQDAQLHYLAVVRPSYCRVLRRIARHGKLRPEVERYWPALEALWQLVNQEIRRLFRRIRRHQMHDALGHHLIADCLSLARLVDQYKRIYAVVLFIGKAIRRTHAGKGRRHGRMARRELFKFCRLGCVRRARSQCQQQIAKVFAGGYRKELEGVDHHVCVTAVRQMELDGHAVRISGGAPIKHIRYSSRIGESHCRWDDGAVEQHRPAQPCCLGRRLEGAFGNDALGMVGAEPWMDTPYFIHCIDELLLNWLNFSPDDRNPY